MIDRRADSLRARILVFAGVLGCAFLGLLGRLAYLQVVKHEEYSRLAEAQHAKTIPLVPKRGPILDRAGQPLAVSSQAESLYALPARIDDAGRLAARLAPVLGDSPAEIRKRLLSSKRFLFVKRRLPPALAQAVRDLEEPALGFVEESLRLYPARELAAHVIGFEGVDGRGLGGVEQAWDRHLSGEEGRAIVERDALGREFSAAPTVLKPPRPGHGVVLTIDTTLQYIAEREVDAAWRRTRAKAAMAVAMDPRTGDVLAVAIRPTFNPNSFSTATDEERRNRAVTDPFEPGSTFKVILAAAALEEGVARPGDRFHGENGLIRIGTATIHDWKRYGWLTFAEVLQNSSNVGSIKVGLALGKERYHKYITGFGFGALTGVGLPGESRGQLRPPNRWSGLSLATMSIGQEISVTALQMVTSFSAVANGGRLMQPQLVRALLDAEGREVQTFEPRVVRQVMSAEAARTLTAMMTNVVAHGTGRNAAIAGHVVAGKTGTAQKIGPGDPEVLAGARRALVRRLRPRRQPPARHDRHARRAEEREMGQRGGRPDLRRHRARGPAAPECPAGRHEARPPRRRGADRGRQGRAAGARRCRGGGDGRGPGPRRRGRPGRRDARPGRALAAPGHGDPRPRSTCCSRSPAAASWSISAPCRARPCRRDRPAGSSWRLRSRGDEGEPRWRPRSSSMPCRSRPRSAACRRR